MIKTLCTVCGCTTIADEDAAEPMCVSCEWDCGPDVPELASTPNIAAAWTPHSRHEHHSTEAGYGVAAWPTGWAVYDLATSTELARGTAKSLRQAKARARSVADGREDYDRLLELCEATKAHV